MKSTFALALMMFTASACAQQPAPRAAVGATTEPAIRSGSGTVILRGDGSSSGGAGGGFSGGWGGGGGSWSTPAMIYDHLEKGSYLGSSVTPAPAVLRDQLKLPRGVGLVVNYVEKGSPAETAGVRQNDVLMKLDDQVLINAQQFAVLVRNAENDKELRLSLIREAKPMEVTATPQERDLAPLEQSSLSPLMRNARLIMPTVGAARMFNMETSDNQYHLSMTESDGKRRLTARDKSGKVVYDGPLDTQEQLKSVPAEVREKVIQMKMAPGMTPATQPFLRMPMKIAPPAQPSSEPPA